MKLLIADDRTFDRTLLRKPVEELGYEVIEAQNGVDALQILQGPDPPSIALIDWMMPGMNGPEICNQIRWQAAPGAYTYLIIVTVKGAHSDLLQGLAAGADEFLVKPIDADELRIRLRTAVRILRLQDELRDNIAELEYKNAQLERHLSEIKTLQGLLPICSHCKRVRGDGGAWQLIERYVAEHTDAQFSHGICPECIKSYYPELTQESPPA